MVDALLRTACFWIAAFAGMVAVASIPFAPMRAVLFPATIVVGGTAAFLFLRMLFSRTCRRGIDAANSEMQGSDPWPGLPKKILDSNWGIFGSRTGSPALLWLRAILALGILPLGLLQRWIGMDVVGLWLAGGFVALELSIMHVALSRPD